jgi:hypothetical protein
MISHNYLCFPREYTSVTFRLRTRNLSTGPCYTHLPHQLHCLKIRHNVDLYNEFVQALWSVLFVVADSWSLIRVLQATSRTWHRYSFCYTRYKRRDHVEVSSYTCSVLLSCLTSCMLGISFKTQALYVAVFVSRYIDIFYEWVSLYNFVMKIFFISSSCYILYLMKFKYRPTHDPSIDTFKAEYLVGPCFLLSLIFNYSFSFVEIFWSFSIFLEAVAILPQLFMLQRTGEAETITTHYLAALGAYRALYIPNWIYRYVASTFFVQLM